jgi:prepilin-type N-terminal cleavage/methylation domain-containing protein
MSFWSDALVNRPPKSNRSRGSTPPPGPRAFTLIELLVVMTVIVIILGLAIPGLSAMNAEARLSSAHQTINGMLTRAYYLSQAEMTMTAVRFLPSEWDTAKDGTAGPAGRQRIAVYRYVGVTDRESGGNFTVAFDEYFKKTEDIPSAELGEGVWVAPLEALSQETVYRPNQAGNILWNSLGQQLVLGGTPGKFAFDADWLTQNGNVADAQSFFNADDFLLVFDPQNGLRAGAPQPYRLRAYVPGAPVSVGPFEADGQDPMQAGDISGNPGYKRYGFSGVIAYSRESFLAESSAAARQEYLRDKGRAFLAHRFGGGLIRANQGS